MNTTSASSMNQTAALDSISTGAALNEEDLADIFAGFFPFVAAGVAAVVAGGAAALWGHKRPGLINR